MGIYLYYIFLCQIWSLQDFESGGRSHQNLKDVEWLTLRNAFPQWSEFNAHRIRFNTFILYFASNESTSGCGLNAFPFETCLVVQSPTCVYTCSALGSRNAHSIEATARLEWNQRTSQLNTTTQAFCKVFPAYATRCNSMSSTLRSATMCLTFSMKHE